jgi:hypothetical protein
LTIEDKAPLPLVIFTILLYMYILILDEYTK